MKLIEKKTTFTSNFFNEDNYPPGTKFISADSNDTIFIVDYWTNEGFAGVVCFDKNSVNNLSVYAGNKLFTKIEIEEIIYTKK